MSEGAPELPKDSQLVRELDALSNDVEVECIGQGGHRSDDRSIVSGGAEITQERPVDLDRVDGEAAEVAERRVAGAEVVDAHSDAMLLQRDDRPERAVDIVHQHGLGDLEVDQRRRHACSIDGPGDPLDQVRLPELLGGEVDGHPDVPPDPGIVAPFRQLPECVVEYPDPDRNDEADGLGDGDELVRRDRAEGRVVPTEQRLEPGDVEARQVEDRLVLEVELIVGERVPELVRQRSAPLGLGPRRPVEDGDPGFPVPFGLVHGIIGIPDQRSRRVGLVADGDADARRDLELVFTDLQRCPQRRHRLLGQSAGVVECVDARAHEHELVAADATDDVVLAQSGPEPTRYGAERLVADRVADPVVDLLELVHVEKGHGDRLPPVWSGQEHLQAFVHAGAIEELGHGIVRCLMGERELRLVALGDVEHRPGHDSRTGVAGALRAGDDPPHDPVRSNDPVRALRCPVASSKDLVDELTAHEPVIRMDAVEVDAGAVVRLDADDPQELVRSADLPGVEVELEAPEAGRRLSVGEPATVRLDALQQLDPFGDVPDDGRSADDRPRCRSDR